MKNMVKLRLKRLRQKVFFYKKEYHYFMVNGNNIEHF